MEWEWLQTINWKAFSESIKSRCENIAEQVKQKLTSETRVIRYNGSYSFRSKLGMGNEKTIAKLVPHLTESGEEVVLIAYSAAIVISESNAQKICSCVQKRTIMHEPFYVFKSPNKYSDEQVAARIYSFIQEAVLAGHEKHTGI